MTDFIDFAARPSMTRRDLNQCSWRKHGGAQGTTARCNRFVSSPAEFSGRRRPRDMNCAPAWNGSGRQRVKLNTKNSVYTPEMLAMLHRTLSDSFAAIAEGCPTLDGQSNDELRVRLASILMDALEGGIVQANLLKDIAIAHVLSDFRLNPSRMRLTGGPH